MAISFNKHNTMIMPPTSPSCFFILLILSACTLSSSFNDTGFAEILIKFKQSLTNTDQLQSWTLPVVEHLCINGSSSWTGILCKGDMINGLRLENMSLGGKIDVDLLSQLPLFSLSLSNNNFSGRFPSDVKKLFRVRRLLLSNNSLSGEIPGDAFMGMNMLMQVELADNMLWGKIPSSLLRVPLRILKVENNQFEGKIPVFWQDGLQGNFSNNKLKGAIPSVFRNEDASMFLGNPGLCGPPLPPCPKPPL